MRLVADRSLSSDHHDVMNVMDNLSVVLQFVSETHNGSLVDRLLVSRGVLPLFGGNSDLVLDDSDLSLVHMSEVFGGLADSVDHDVSGEGSLRFFVSNRVDDSSDVVDANNSPMDAMADDLDLVEQGGQVLRSSLVDTLDEVHVSFAEIVRASRRYRV